MKGILTTIHRGGLCAITIWFVIHLAPTATFTSGFKVLGLAICAAIAWLLVMMAIAAVFVLRDTIKARAEGAGEHE